MQRRTFDRGHVAGVVDRLGGRRVDIEAEADDVLRDGAAARPRIPLDRREESGLGHRGGYGVGEGAGAIETDFLGGGVERRGRGVDCHVARLNLQAAVGNRYLGGVVGQIGRIGQLPAGRHVGDPPAGKGRVFEMCGGRGSCVCHVTNEQRIRVNTLTDHAGVDHQRTEVGPVDRSLAS